MRKILLLISALALTVCAHAQRVIAIDPNSPPPAHQNGDQVDRLYINRETMQLLTSGSGGGGGGGGGSTTFSSPQSFRLSNGSAWQQAALEDGNLATLLTRTTEVRDRLLAGAPQAGAGPVTATTQRVTLASDGPANINLEAIRYATEEAVAGITSPQTTFSMVAVNDSITVGVDAGVDLSIATAVPNFISGGTFEVRFEQFNGTAWSDLTVYPKTLIAGSAPVVSATSVGLYRVRVPNGISQVRVRLSSINTLTEVRAWIERFTDGAKVNLPYVGLTSGTFNLATNNPIVPPIQWDQLGDAVLDFQTVTGTSPTITWQETNDHSGTNWGGTAGNNVSTNTANAAITSMTTSGRIRVTPTAQYFRVNLTYTALTALTINGITATVTSAGTVPSQVNVAVQGMAASGQTINGNPVAIAGEAITAAPGAITGGRAYVPVLDNFRRTITTDHPRELKDTNTITLTGTTETTLITAVASVTHDITNLVFSNGSTTAVVANVRPATGSATIYPVLLPAGQTVSLGFAPSALKQLAANANWTVQLSAIPTGGTNNVTVISISNRTR